MKMIGSGIREALHYKPEILLEQFLDLFVEKACFILWKLNIVPPQNVVTYSLLTKRMCSLPDDNEVWTRYRLRPQAFDDSSSCWHGNLSTGMTCCADSKCIEVKLFQILQFLKDISLA